jgi:hypothetical protein
MGFEPMSILYRYLSRRIIIDLYPSWFVFTLQGKNSSLCIATFLYFRKDEALWVPLAIGEEISSEYLSAPNIYRINLFGSNDHLPAEWSLDREVLIQLFLEYGIGKCFESFWLPQLRPIVFLLGADRFGAQFKNPGDVFAEAARCAGACLVILDRTEL